MKLNESEFEQTLRELRPIAPTAGLEMRVAEALAEKMPLAMLPSRELKAAAVSEEGVIARFFRGFGWACAGAAAAVAVIAAMPRNDAPQRPAVVHSESAAAPDADSFQHMESTAELIAAEDEGVTYDSAQEPVRQVRYSSVERHVWTNPRTGARMEFQIPREDVRLTPVSMQ